MSLADEYTAELRRERRRFATWEPGLRLRIGDYGDLAGSRFVYSGNIGDDFGIQIKPRSNDGQDSHVIYASSGRVDYGFSLGAKADVGPIVRGSGDLEVSFSSEHGIFFNAAGVTYEYIGNQLDVGRGLIEAFARDEWQHRWVVVTELAHAALGTIAISGSSGAHLKLAAGADVPEIDLADASLGLTVASEKSLAMKVVAERGLTPLMGLARVRPKAKFWWGRPEFRNVLGFDEMEREEMPERFDDLLDEHTEDALQRAQATGSDVTEAFDLTTVDP